MEFQTITNGQDGGRKETAPVGKKEGPRTRALVPEARTL